MMTLTLEYAAFIIVFFLAFSVSLALVPMAIGLGRRFGIVAVPGGRRRHQGKISTLGGIAIFGGFTVAAIAAQFLPVPRFDPYEIIRLSGLILGGLVIFAVGILDDIYELNPVQIGVGQIIAAGIAVSAQIFIETINNPFTGQQTDLFPPVITVALSMFWLGIMMNTVNFMDGLDGLAAGVAFITGAMLFINSAFVLQPAQTSVSLLPLSLMGASLGFLLYNFNPARVFMGGGALYLGYLVGTLSIIGGAKMATVLLVMGLPLMDFTWQIVNRLRRGRNPMKGDRGHIHFRLQDVGYGQRLIVVVYYLFCACFGVLTLVTTSQLFKFIAFGVMVIMIIGGFFMVARTSSKTNSSWQNSASGQDA
jgi:UDP-GlcNAc:undecaprenyl-phosphate/decaprenyl-phosphate GlcNAc-1-phosphate transferase